VGSGVYLGEEGGVENTLDGDYSRDSVKI
jgi:hypothetical protein